MAAGDAGINDLRIACPQKLLEVDWADTLPGEFLGKGGIPGNCPQPHSPVAM